MFLNLYKHCFAESVSGCCGCLSGPDWLPLPACWPLSCPKRPGSLPHLLHHCSECPRCPVGLPRSNEQVIKQISYVLTETYNF